MRKKIGKTSLTVTAITQKALLYLGLIIVFFSVVALIFSSTERSVELLTVGSGFIVVRYLLSFLFVPIASLLAEEEQ